MSLQDIKGNLCKLIARLTPLGWTCVGMAESPSMLQTRVTRTFFTRDDAKINEINKTLRKFWEVEKIGSNNDPEMPSTSREHATKKIAQYPMAAEIVLKNMIEWIQLKSQERD